MILGCEYACKDAVEVLLRSGAEVTATDGFNHDSYHYARLSKNPELVALVKSYLDSANKGREASKQGTLGHTVPRWAPSSSGILAVSCRIETRGASYIPWRGVVVPQCAL